MTNVAPQHDPAPHLTVDMHYVMSDLLLIALNLPLVQLSKLQWKLILAFSDRLDLKAHARRQGTATQVE